MGHKCKLVRNQKRAGQGGLLLWAVNFDQHIGHFIFKTFSFSNSGPCTCHFLKQQVLSLESQLALDFSLSFLPHFLSALMCMVL